MGTKVIYRKYKDGGDILACFPELPADNYGRLMSCYQHIGQHGAAYWGCVLRLTVPANEEEYRELAEELERIGYEDLVEGLKDTPVTRRARAKNAGR